MYRSINKMLSPHPFTPAGGEDSMKGGKRRGVPVKTLKKILKKAGLKTTGKKAALTRRAKKAKLMMKGGLVTEGMKDQGSSSVETAFNEPLETEDGDTTTGATGNMSTTNMSTGKGRKGKPRSKKGIYGMGGMPKY
jgi:hypothetical protein